MKKVNNYKISYGQSTVVQTHSNSNLIAVLVHYLRVLNSPMSLYNMTVEEINVKN